MKALRKISHPARPGRAALLLLLGLAALAASSCRGPSTGEGSGRPGVVRNPEDYPLGYSMGSFDERFGITKEAFLGTAAEAKSVWEKAAGRPLFRPDAGAPFRLNLVFDERQEQTIEAKKMKAAIDSKGRSYDALVWQHERRLERMKESGDRYDAAVAALKKRLDDHNAVVEAWNAKGGAPAGEFARLEAELSKLKEGESDVRRLLEDYNADVAAVNDLVTQINEVVSENNLQVSLFNGKFVESREFEQGVYDGGSITIYQFSGMPELRLALIHEFGHALGFGHVDDPKAVMHYMMGKQDAAHPSLAAADLALLREKFGGD